MSTSFVKATISESAEGELVADVSCLNGATSSGQYDIPAGATYYNGNAINSGDDLLFTVNPEGQLDTSYIFPYNENTGNPLAVGGGIGKGTVIEDPDSSEGATGSGGSENPPTNAAVAVLWINGLAASGTINNISDDSLTQLNVGTEVMFLMTYNASDEPEIINGTQSQGSCGDVSGLAGFTFGEPASFAQSAR